MNNATRRPLGEGGRGVRPFPKPTQEEAMTVTAMSRTAVRLATECPACKAGPGKPCQGKRGKAREANHRERVEAAERVLETAERYDPNLDFDRHIQREARPA
jgi:hypothetical protein